MPFCDEFKKFNFKGKIKNKKQIFTWPFFNSFSLVFFYLFAYLCKYVGPLSLPTHVGR
jgi:hypothetical protein